METENKTADAKPAKSKKNTVVFIAVATIVNLILIFGFSFLGMLVFALIFSDPGKSAGVGASLTLFLLCFLLPIILSWLIYNFLVKLIFKKSNLEDRLVPLFDRKRRNGR